MARRRVSFVITARNKGFIKALDQSRRRLARFGRKMERMGRTLTRSITVPVGIAGGAAIKMASDFESSMTRIETLVGLSREQVQGMRRDVLALSGETSKAPHELSEALFAVTSAGIRGSNAMNVLERSAKASAIGLGNTREIARATTAVMQAYGEETVNAAQATDTLTAIVREGNLEAEELAPVLGRVVGMASQLNISFAEVGASVATFTRLGVSAEEAVTGLRGVMNALLKQTPKAQKALDSIGLTFDSLEEKIGEKGLARTLIELVKRFKETGNAQGLSALLGRVRGLAAVLGTAGAQGEQYVDILDNIQQANGIVDRGFERVSETTEFQFNKALNNLRVTAVKFGAIMLPVANKVLKAVTRMTEGWIAMSDKARKKILVVAGLLAVGGPLMIAIGKVIKIITTLATVANAKFALIVGAVGLLITIGKNLVDNWGVIKTELGNLWDGIVMLAWEMANSITEAFTTNFVEMIRGMKFIAGAVEPALMPALVGAESALLSLGDATEEGLEKASEEFDKSSEKAIEARENIVGLGESFQSLINMVKEAGGLSNVFSIFEPAGENTQSETSQPASPIGMAGLTLDDKVETFEKNINRMKAAVTGFASASKQAVELSMSFWDKFVQQSKAAGFDFVHFLTSQVSSAIAGFSENIGQMMAGAGDEFATGLQQIILVVIDFAKRLAKLLIGIGTAIAFVPGLQGPAGAYIGGGAALMALASGAGAAIQKNINKRRERQQSVSDALMRSDGSIVRLHPNDDLLASQNLGGMLQPAMPGAQVIKNELFLDGQTVWNNQRRVNTNKRR